MPKIADCLCFLHCALRWHSASKCIGSGFVPVLEVLALIVEKVHCEFMVGGGFNRDIRYKKFCHT